MHRLSESHLLNLVVVPFLFTLLHIVCAGTFFPIAVFGTFLHFLLQVLVTFYTLHINTGAGTGRSYFFGSFNALWLLLLGVSWFNFNFHCHDYVDFNDIRHCDCDCC